MNIKQFQVNILSIWWIIAIVFGGSIISALVPIPLISLSLDEIIKSGTLKYLGSALIQSFAALIAIPFAFYASYLHSKYGYTGLQFATNRVKTSIFPGFVLIAIISTALIIFPNYPDIPNIKLPYFRVLNALLGSELLASAILLYLIYQHLIEVMSVTPSKLVEKIIQPDQIRRDLLKSNPDFKKALERYQGAFELVIFSLKNPTSYNEAKQILSQLRHSFRDYPFNITTETYQEIEFLHNILTMSNANVVAELEKTGPVIPYETINEYVKSLTSLYLEILLKHSSEINKLGYLSSEWDYRLWKIVKQTHQEFYNALQKLSSLYNKNFYYSVYFIIRDVEQKIPDKGSEKSKSMLIKIKLDLVAQNYEYIRKQVETAKSLREKLVTVSEFNFIPLLQDGDIGRTYIQNLIISFNDIYKYPTQFLEIVNEIITEAQNQRDNEEALRYLCPVGKSLLKTLIFLAGLVSGSDKIAVDMGIKRVKDAFIKNSLPILKKLNVKATFSEEYLFIDCMIEQAMLHTPLYVGDLPDKYDQQRLSIICKYLKEWGLEKHIEGCENNGNNLKENPGS